MTFSLTIRPSGYSADNLAQMKQWILNFTQSGIEPEHPVSNGDKILEVGHPGKPYHSCY